MFPFQSVVAKTTWSFRQVTCPSVKNFPLNMKIMIMVDNDRLRGGADCELQHCVLSSSAVSNSLWPYDCSPQGSLGNGIFQARILEWVAISFFSYYRTTKIWSVFTAQITITFSLSLNPLFQSCISFLSEELTHSQLDYLHLVLDPYLCACP